MSRDDTPNVAPDDAGRMREAAALLCMYGFPHPGSTNTIHGFACQREGHARAAVFGR